MVKGRMYVSGCFGEEGVELRHFLRMLEGAKITTCYDFVLKEKAVGNKESNYAAIVLLQRKKIPNWD